MIKNLSTIICIIIFHFSIGQSNKLDRIKAFEHNIAKNPIQAKNELIVIYNSSSHDFDTKSKYFNLKYIGVCYLYLSNFDSSIYYFEKASEFLDEIEKKEQAAIHNNLALAYQKSSNFEKSLSSYDNSLEISIQLKDSVGIARAYFNMGSLYRSISQLDQALSNFELSLKIYTKLNDKKAIAQILNSFGLIQYTLKNYEKAIDLFTQSLDIRNEINDIKGSMDTENNLAAVFIDKKDFQQAKTHQIKCLDYAKKMNKLNLIGGSNLNLGIISKNIKDYEKSQFYYNEAILVFEKTKNRRGLLSSYTNLGLLQIDLEQYKKAKKNLELAKEIAKKNESIEDLIKINRGLSKLYQNLELYKQAFDVHVELERLSDSLFKIETSNRIIEMQERFESTQKDLEIKTLKSQAELEKEKKKVDTKNIQIIILIISIIAFISIFFAIRLRYKKKLILTEKNELEFKKQLIQKDLDLKDRKLASLATESLHQDEFIGELNNLFDKIQNEDSLSDTNLALYKNLLQKNKLEKKDWETFKVHFNNVHPDFFKELETRFPNLTKNDLRICAYIKLDLLNREIASLMNIAPTSVKMTKNRIKKKIGLDENEHLQDLINQIN